MAIVTGKTSILNWMDLGFVPYDNSWGFIFCFRLHEFFFHYAAKTLNIDSQTLNEIIQNTHLIPQREVQGSMDRIGIYNMYQTMSFADKNCTLTQSCRPFLPVFHEERWVNGGMGAQRNVSNNAQ